MVETKHLTVMFTDIKGFTKKTSVKKREDIEKFLDLHEELVMPIFKKHKGRVVKNIGDAFMVVFHSPTNAVLCGIEIQERLKKYNNDPKSDENVEVRIAVNSGEVHVRGDDVFGEAVNIAARIEGLAEANEIWFTDSVYLSMNKSEIPSAEIGHRKLKGIAEEIKVYKVLREGKHAKKAHDKRARLIEKSGLGFFSRLKNFWIRRKRWIIAGLIILLIIGIATDPKNIVKKESNIDKFVSNAENAIKNGNYEEAKKLTNRLDQIPRDDVPPRLALEGAKLYAFLRNPEKAFEYVQLAKENNPTKEEMADINHFIDNVLKKATPEQRERLKELAR